jgi:PAS domain S-box-containing protein
MRTKLTRPSFVQLLPILFFLLAAIPAGAIGVLLTHSAWERELQTVQEQHLQIARNLVAALTRYAEDVEAVFQMTVANMAAQQPVRHLSTLLSSLHFKHVCIVNAQGQVEHHVAPDADLKMESVPQPLLEKLRAGATWEVLIGPRGPFNAQALYFRWLAIDDQSIHNRAGEPTLFLLQPLDSERYALGALRTEYFIELQSAIAFGKQGHAAIVDRRGRIIAHPNAQWRTAMRDLSALEPVRRMMHGETGVTRFFSTALQEEVIAGFSTVPEVGWGVMIPQPLSELAAHVSRVKRAVWSVIGMALLCAGVLGVLVSRWLSSPLRYIGLVAERFANGAYEARVHALGVLHTREAATLAAQFNSMADEVTQSWQARSASEQRFRAFAEIAADWFWETDLQQVFTYISLPSKPGRHQGVAAIGHHRCEYVLDDLAGSAVARIQSYMDRAVPFDDVELQVLGEDGHPIYMASSGRPIYDAAGGIVGYRGVTRDITARLYAEEQLRQAQQDAQRRQAQKMEAIGVLAGGIAHDFNNILSAVLGYTDLALRKVAPSTPVAQYLQEVLTAGRRAQSLVQQILMFSRASEPERIPVQIRLIVKEVLKLLRASLPTTIDIRQDVDHDDGAVLADSTQIHQVLMNLCANAEYAMRDTGGILEVRLDTVELDTGTVAHYAELVPGSYLRLTIRDTGHGIPPEVATRVFEPFFTTKGVGQGTGMGLSVVHGIVTGHGGAIRLQSMPEQGTTCEVYLPRLDMVVDDTTSQDESLPVGKGVILFIDDEEAIARVSQRMLEQLGFQAVVCTSSLAALETFHHAPYHFDLVITDQTMPHMTGEVLACELRLIRPDIPIILCTGFSHTIDAEKAQAQGIDAFLMKPLVPRDLGLAIQHVLEQRAVGQD